jgi:uncharacterized protein YjbI with pentapeptide repeats
MNILIVSVVGLAVVLGAAVLSGMWWSRHSREAVRADSAALMLNEQKNTWWRIEPAEVPKALAGIIAIGGFAVTAYTAISTQRAATLARERSNQLTQYEHYQKALESLTKTGHTDVLHAGAMFALGDMAKERPEWGKTVAMELALAALSYGPSSGGAVSSGGSQGPPPGAGANVRGISREAQVALSVLGSLDVMTTGLPLQLADGNFGGAVLAGARLNGAQLPGAYLAGSELFLAQLYGANLRGATLSGSNLTDSRLTNAGLYGAVLCEGLNTVVSVLNKGARVGVQMMGATSDGADFENAWLIGALLATDPSNKPDKHVTNFSHANFRSASLKGADLSGSDLHDAYFDDADLTGADFTLANVNGATWEGARKCRTTGPDGQKMQPETCPPWDVPPQSGEGENERESA